MTPAEREAVREFIVAAVKAEVALRPGRDGKDGERGADGRDGKDAVLDVPAIVREVVALVPVPKDGANGRDGKDGAAGERGEPGLKGEPGRDGKDGVPGPVGISGEKGMDGRDGRDGSPGRDGITMEQVELAAGRIALKIVGSIKLEGRSLTFGDQTTQIPIPIYRDVWREENAPYGAGDMVTFGGSVWHANAATSEKPGEGSTAWTLVVKRGRDGKDGTKRP